MKSSLDNYLRMYRKRVGLHQAFVARLLGSHTETSVGRHENGQRLPTLEVALAYAIIYGISVEQLFAGLKENSEDRIRARAEKLLSKTRNETTRSFLVSFLDDSELRYVPWPEE